MEQEKKQKPNIIEIAHKKRHIHLLEELQTNKSLPQPKIRELQRYEGGPVMPGIVSTQEDVAKAFAVAARTVPRWIKDGMPVLSDGRYNLLDIDGWRLLRQKQKEDHKPNLKDFWDVKLKESKSKLSELALKKATAELIPKGDIERILDQMIGSFKRQILSLPRIMAPQLVGLEPREIEALLSTRIREIIGAFAQGKKLFKK